MTNPTAPDIVALTTQTLTIIERFNDAFNRNDVAGMVALMTADTVCESTFPPPDGFRAEGRAAVSAFFSDMFLTRPRVRVEVEEIQAWGEHCLVRWMSRWTPQPGAETSTRRGVDVFTLRGGLIAEKLSYIKG
jgi:ketosteroid isomerase-like protein